MARIVCTQVQPQTPTINGNPSLRIREQRAVSTSTIAVNDPRVTVKFNLYFDCNYPELSSRVMDESSETKHSPFGCRPLMEHVASP